MRPGPTGGAALGTLPWFLPSCMCTCGPRVAALSLQILGHVGRMPGRSHQPLGLATGQLWHLCRSQDGSPGLGGLARPAAPAAVARRRAVQGPA